MAKLNYYQNQLFIVGKIWLPPITCGYTYDLGRRKDENLEEHLKNGTIKQWVDMKAAKDFKIVKDFRLEYFNTLINFEDENSCFTDESWYAFDRDWTYG